MRDSIITVTLQEVEGGTLLTLVHSNVPDEQTSYEQGGWQEHYFEPMKEYFADRKQVGAWPDVEGGCAQDQARSGGGEIEPCSTDGKNGGQQKKAETRNRCKVQAQTREES